ETSAAVARLEQALRLEPQGAQALQLIGESLRYENKIEEAERRFREGLKVNPESIPLLGDLAQVLGDQMRYAEAFACIEKSLARGTWRSNAITSWERSLRARFPAAPSRRGCARWLTTGSITSSRGRITRCRWARCLSTSAAAWRTFPGMAATSRRTNEKWRRGNAAWTPSGPAPR